MNDLDTLTAVVENANYAPELSDQIMLVTVMDKIEKIIKAMKHRRSCHEHTASALHLRIALNHERDLMFEMMRKNAPREAGAVAPSLHADVGQEVNHG